MTIPSKEISWLHSSFAISVVPSDSKTFEMLCDTSGHDESLTDMSEAPRS